MATGTASSYDLTIGIRLEIEDLIHTLTPTDVPLLGTYNGTSDLPPGPGFRTSALSDESVMQKKYEWLEEELLTPRTTLAATALTADTYITVASGERERFATADIAKIGTEVVRITGFGSTADTLTVTRAFGGSAAQWANASDVIGVGSASAEGSDPAAHRFRDRTTAYNLTEIFGPHQIKVSGTEETIAQRGGKYGVTSEFAHQVGNRTREMAIAVEQAILYGVRVDDTSNEWRSMGGLTYFITTNLDSTTTDITYSKILDNWQLSYNQGGMVDLLVMNASQKRKLGQFDNTTIRLARTDRIRGQVVDVILSDFGEAAVLIDRHAKSSDMFGLDVQYINLVTLRPFMVEPLAKTGDAMQSQVLCEKGLKVRLQKRHFRFSALT